MKLTACLVLTGVVLSGCSVKLQPFGLEELEAKREARLEQFTANQEEITRPVTLYDAMARALKYNLDYKVELYEEALRNSESDLSNLDMLPRLVASAGFSDRDNFSGSSSSALLSSDTIGGQSLVSSTSSDRDVFDADLTLSWDVLDFGLSYVRAKQSADAVLIANERKRRVANRIIEDVRTAYWRAVSAQNLVDRLSSLEDDIEKALTESDAAFRKKQTSPLAALTYQRELLDIQNTIQQMHSESVAAKRQLAALMNVSPSTVFTLAIPDRDTRESGVVFKPEAMVRHALVNRPELRELNYEQRISENEATGALLDLLPSLRVFGGFNHNSNDFLFNSDWLSWGAQASWNIFKVFSYPATQRTNELQQELLNQRSLALTMAVITQVHVGISRYEIAKRRMNTSHNYFDVNNNIMEQTQKGYDARSVSYQNFVREQMNSIVAEARFDVARASLENAYANIFASIGQDTFGDIDVEESSVADLGNHLQGYWESLRAAVRNQN